MSLPLDDGVHELKLGNSFESRPKVGFHTIRYDFKPASVATSKEACVEVGGRNQVTVTVPHVEGSGTPHTVFRGNKQNLMKECVLIINHDTGTFTLEKLASKVTLKKTRLEGSSMAMQHLSSSQLVPGDGKKPTKAARKSKKKKEKMSPGKEKEPATISSSESLVKVTVTENSNKRVAVAEMSDSLSSSGDDNDDMEDVKPSISPPPPPPPPQQQQQQQAPLPPPPQPKATSKFQPPSSASSNARNFGVLDNDLALSESSSDDSD